MTIVGDVFPDERRGRATGVLMSGFALAAVVGVPFGLFLGGRYGWHMPFIVLAAASLPTLILTFRALPRLDAHVQARRVRPLHALRETFAHAGHLRAFALSAALTIGGYAVFPYVSTYFLVGCFAALVTLFALRLAWLVRAVDAPPVAAESLSLAAAAESRSTPAKS